MGLFHLIRRQQPIMLDNHRIAIGRYNSIHLNSVLSKISVLGSSENLNSQIIIIIIISQILLQLIYSCVFYKQITVLLLRTKKYADDVTSPKRCRCFHHTGMPYFNLRSSTLLRSFYSMTSVADRPIVTAVTCHICSFSLTEYTTLYIHLVKHTFSVFAALETQMYRMYA